MIFKRFFVQYLDSSIHVSLAVAALSYVSCQRLNLNLVYELYGFVFFSTIVMYNYIKIQGKYKQIRYKGIVIFSLFGLGICAFFLHWGSLLIAFIAFLISCLYITPIFPFKKGLRSIGGFVKIAIVACCWAVVTVLLPIIEHFQNDSNFIESISYQLREGGAIFLARIFLFILALMIPFEIRDLRYDNLKLDTLPQRIGIRKTKWLGLLFVLGFIIGNNNSLDLLIGLFVGSSIIYADVDRTRSFTDFWVEGIPIGWAIGLLLFK